jgi:hypothetical protein
VHKVIGTLVLQLVERRSGEISEQIIADRLIHAGFWRMSVCVRFENIMTADATLYENIVIYSGFCQYFRRFVTISRITRIQEYIRHHRFGVVLGVKW